MKRAPCLALPVLALLPACGAGDAETPPVTLPVASVTPPAPPPGPAKPAYPAAEKRAVTDTYGTLHVEDDYRWLENWDDPAVKAWSQAENEFARKWLDAGRSRAAIRARVEQLVGDTSPSWGGLTARRGVYFAFERRPPKEQPYLIVTKSLDDLSSSRVLVDPSVLDPSGSTSITWFVPSVDGKRVAVSLAKAGAESGDVHVFDVATGKEATDDVPQADGAGEGDCLAWKADGSGFFYTQGRPDGASPNAYRHIQFHKLGDPAAKDKAVLGQDGQRIDQWEVGTGDDGKTIVARVEDGDSGRWEHWVLGASGKWVKAAAREDDVEEVRVGPDGSIFFLSAKGAPRRRLLRSPASTPTVAKAEVVLPEGDAVMDDVLATRSRLYAVEDTGGLSRVRSFAYAKGKAGAATVIPTRPYSAVAGLVSLGADDAAFSNVSYTEPPAIYRVTGKDGAVTKTALAATTSADFSGVEVTRDTCTSKDGSKVPLLILRRGTGPLTGDTPTILYGYGGFGISILPRFRASRLAWLEQGAIYAVANIRGGGELGEDWHTGGNLTHKQNGFDDFFACGQHLVDAKYTNPKRLAIWGGSNGGLLMGAELTQHPGEWKAVVAEVGLFDMMRFERDSNGAFNVTEYGTTSDPAQRDALFAYSPYQHVKDGTAYPAVLFMTGANDPRVATYHSRKMVARLQAATSSDAPILLRTSANTGHGRGTPLTAQIEEATDIYSFLFQELGVDYKSR